MQVKHAPLAVPVEPASPVKSAVPRPSSLYAQSVALTSSLSALEQALTSPQLYGRIPGLVTAVKRFSSTENSREMALNIVKPFIDRAVRVIEAAGDAKAAHSTSAEILTQLLRLSHGTECKTACDLVDRLRGTKSEVVQRALTTAHL